MSKIKRTTLSKKKAIQVLQIARQTQQYRVTNQVMPSLSNWGAIEALIVLIQEHNNMYKYLSQQQQNMVDKLVNV